jgi:glucosyl-dolichyl phosphate glucuronosyltransferase
VRESSHMSMPDVSVSVVICAYTEARWDDLVAAVASVRHQTVPALDLIVVIDHNPSLLARAQETFADSVVIENHQSQGLSGARNSGIETAQGDIIAFLDDDAEAAPDWLEQLLAAYADPRVGGVGGAIEPLWLSAKPAWFPDEFNWVVGCTYRGMPRTTAPIRNQIGANMSFRREVFSAIGGFRNGVGQIGASMLRCDDTEFGIRVRQQCPQFITLYEPRAIVRHRVPDSRARWRYFGTRCYTEGLAKAIIARLVGTRDGLASERAYTFRTLPAGVARGFGDALMRREAGGLGRAGSIIGGLALTTAGYVVGTLAQWLRLSRIVADETTLTLRQRQHAPDDADAQALSAHRAANPSVEQAPQPS